MSLSRWKNSVPKVGKVSGCYWLSVPHVAQEVFPTLSVELSQMSDRRGSCQSALIWAPSSKPHPHLWFRRLLSSPAPCRLCSPSVWWQSLYLQRQWLDTRWRRSCSELTGVHICISFAPPDHNPGVITLLSSGLLFPKWLVGKVRMGTGQWIQWPQLLGSHPMCGTLSRDLFTNLLHWLRTLQMVPLGNSWWRVTPFMLLLHKTSRGHKMYRIQTEKVQF